MPQTVTITDGFLDETYTFECATENELLDFANRLRIAGAAEPLAALLPSVPGESNSCLIANAVNFNSLVRPDDAPRANNGEQGWYMEVDSDTVDWDTINAIAEVCESTPYENEETGNINIPLPRLIGNAADAFDYGAAFTHYATKEHY